MLRYWSIDRLIDYKSSTEKESHNVITINVISQYDNIITFEQF